MTINKIFGFLFSNSTYSNFLFWYNTKRLKKEYYRLNLNAPRTFNEKVSWIKFNVRNPSSVQVADKFLVRDYVQQKAGNDVLIPLIKVYDSPELIDFNELPNEFVMKLNNGSGYNLICKDKRQINFEFEKNKFLKAFNSDIYGMSREWHYKKIKPRVIVEKLLVGSLLDYKFFCNNEGPFMIQVDVDRFTDHRRNIYDMSWNLMPQRIRYENTKHSIEKPRSLSAMIELAKLLSSDFQFCRIDLYEHGNKVYFGEITLHPGGGVEPFDSFSSDLKFGTYINLD
ncbi:MAG: hypothetical protein RLZZ71_160 [Bacteroidota bacterium]